MKGLVLKSTGSWYEVLTPDNKLFAARTRGKLRLKGFRTTNPIAVGDYVELKPENDKEAVITEILPRENYIIRKSVKQKSHGHIIASNIDQAVLIATLVYPRTSLGFIDRFLISAEAFRIPQVLIFNKIDMMKDRGNAMIDEILSIYEPLGVRCLKASALTGEGMDEIMDLLDGKKTLISGHSGVGKSTLINKISPEISQKTSEISEFAQKGTHTTTFAEMFQIGTESFIIDTPGIKELGLVDIEDEELSDYFPEMRAIQNNCKFHNCKHLHEPQCAIKEAVENGEIADTRYISYLSILEGEDNRR